MGEEENKTESGDKTETASETGASANDSSEKPEIADRLRDMGVMDHKKSDEQSGKGRRITGIIVGGLVVAAGVIYWLQNNEGVDEHATEVADARNMPANPHGWQGGPPPAWARPGMPPPQHQVPSQHTPPAWPPAPPYYYGAPPPQYYDQSQGQRQFGPRPPHYYGGPPRFARDNSPAGETGDASDAPESAVGDELPARPNWWQPPSPPARPAWAQPPVPGPYGTQEQYYNNTRYGSSAQRFGPPPPRDYRSSSPPGWPRDAWRSRRPEANGAWEEDTSRTHQRQQPRWPQPAPNNWAPQQYGPYGPPPWPYRPVSMESDTSHDNPWSR